MFCGGGLFSREVLLKTPFKTASSTCNNVRLCSNVDFVHIRRAPVTCNLSGIRLHVLAFSYVQVRLEVGSSNSLLYGSLLPLEIWRSLPWLSHSTDPNGTLNPGFGCAYYWPALLGQIVFPGNGYVARLAVNRKVWRSSPPRDEGTFWVPCRQGTTAAEFSMRAM